MSRLDNIFSVLSEAQEMLEAKKGKSKKPVAPTSSLWDEPLKDKCGKLDARWVTIKGSPVCVDKEGYMIFGDPKLAPRKKGRTTKALKGVAKKAGAKAKAAGKAAASAAGKTGGGALDVLGKAFSDLDTATQQWQAGGK